jgi:dTDP-4-dehydrorhamnose 3,5-epimerase-like enzyme
LRCDDPTVGVAWQPMDASILNLSDEDTNAPFLQEAEINITFE